MGEYSIAFLEGGDPMCQSIQEPTVPWFRLSEGSERSWSERSWCEGFKHQNHQGKQHVCTWLSRTATYLEISVMVATLILFAQKENASLIEAGLRQITNTLEARVAMGTADQRHALALQQSQFARLEAKVRQINTLKARHALELQRLESRFETLEAEMQQNFSSIKTELEYNSVCSWLSGWQQDQVLQWCKVGAGVQAYSATDRPSDKVTLYRVMLPHGHLDWSVYQNVCTSWQGCNGGKPVAYFAHYENGTFNIDNNKGDINTTMNWVGTDNVDAAKYEQLCVGDSVWTGGCCYGPHACNDGNGVSGQRYALCGCSEH